MTTKFCIYCNQPLIEIKGNWICPVHGKVLEEKKEVDEPYEDYPYIG